MKKSILAILLITIFALSTVASAALYEGSWNTDEVGTMPGGETLKNGEYHQDWKGSGTELIGSEVLWNSLGDSGAQWTVQGVRDSATVLSDWWEVEGANTYYYQLVECRYVGDGWLTFDGDVYTGSGWTQYMTYTGRYLYDGESFIPEGVVGDMKTDGVGVFDTEPFDIEFSIIFQQTDFNLAERWDEGQSSYFEIEINSITAPCECEAIDFESTGLSEGDPLGTITTSDNEVTFSTDLGPCYLAEVGAPRGAFEPDDTPSGGNPGSFFLSDDKGSGGWDSHPYYITFANPVSCFSLDLYDYMGDGGAEEGDTATLTVFADHAMTQPVGSDSFTVPSPQPPDGYVVTLSVPTPTSHILAASLTYDADDGTGIDNIKFCTVLSCVEDDSGALDIGGSVSLPGGTVSIPVRIQNAPNTVNSLGFEVAFPSCALSFTGFERGSIVEEFAEDSGEFMCSEPEAGIVRCGGFESPHYDIPQGASGELVKLKFDVNFQCDEAEMLVLQELKDDIANWSTSHGCFNCTAYCQCDVNGDGEVTPADALCAFQCYLGRNPTDCGPRDEVCDCVDVNHDGKTTPRDALEILFEYLGMRSACGLPTVYENGEDGDILGWSVFDNTPSGATITNIYDTARCSQVVVLSGDGTNNGYLFEDGNLWHNSSQTTFRWSMKCSEEVRVFVDVETDDGHRYINYTPVDYDALSNKSGEYVHHGLGSDIMDGKWHTFIRDLQADLQEDQYQWGVSITEVNGIRVRGSASFDDIILY